MNYFQFLLAIHTNHTFIYFSDHASGLSHDSINRFLRRDKITSPLIWEHVKSDVVYSSEGCLIFDDSVLDKNHSNRIEMVRSQYSGNAHGLIKGIGMVNCVYVNPDTEQSWVIVIAATANKGAVYNCVLFEQCGALH